MAEVNSELRYKLKLYISSGSEVEKKIAGAIFKEPKIILKLSIQDLARHVKTSEASIVRFAKKLGFLGYADLKKQMVQQILEKESSISPNSLFNLKLSDNLKEITKHIEGFITSSLVETKNLLDYATLDKVVNDVGIRNRFIFFGIEASGLSAIEGAKKFCRLGLDATFSTEINDLILKLNGSCSQSPLIILFSHSGMGRSVIRAVEEISKRDLDILLITHNRSSQIVDKCRYLLINGSEGEKISGDSIGTRVSQLFIIDILYTELLKIKIKRDKKDSINLLPDILNTSKKDL